ncbi:hypothetical protein BJ741DRAFT_707117 [Chytriomyces cf. hyalinus JEL632]|nr:hypothetical protein BJ741DRAFT_707117 [Chytriomyces cf. hyalinus JEL632]
MANKVLGQLKQLLQHNQGIRLGVPTSLQTISADAGNARIRDRKSLAATLSILNAMNHGSPIHLIVPVSDTVKDPSALISDSCGKMLHSFNTSPLFVAVNSAKSNTSTVSILDAIARQSRANEISTLVSHATLNDYLALLKSFPFSQKSESDSSSDSLDVGHLLNRKVFHEFSHQNCFRALLRKTKPKNAGLWGSKDASAFGIDIYRPLIGMTDAEIHNYCKTIQYDANDQSASSSGARNSSDAEDSETSSNFTYRPLEIQAERESMAKSLKLSISNRNTTGAIVEITPKEVDQVEDVVHVLQRVSQAFEDFDAEVDQVISSCIMHDPPTGSTFIKMPTTGTGSLLHNNWMFDTFLAQNILGDIIAWTTGSHTSVHGTCAESFRANIMKYYQLNEVVEHKKRLHTGRQFPRFANSHVQLEPPRNGADHWVLARAPIPKSKANKMLIYAGEVKLWDNRFFVSVSPAASAEGGDTEVETASLLAGLDLSTIRFCIRPFTLTDYRNLLDRMYHNVGDFGGFADIEALKQRLAHYMVAMPVEARHTIPCVAVVQDNGDDSYVVSVPGIGVITERGVVDVKCSFNGEAWRMLPQTREEISFSEFEGFD